MNYTMIWLHSSVYLKLSCFLQQQYIPESHFTSETWSLNTLMFLHPGPMRYLLFVLPQYLFLRLRLLKELNKAFFKKF